MGDVFLNICWNNSKRELSAFFANATSFYIISISLIICLFLSPVSASKSPLFFTYFPLPLFSSSFFCSFFCQHLISSSVSSLYALLISLLIASHFVALIVVIYWSVSCSHLFSSVMSHLFFSLLIYYIYLSHLICCHVLSIIIYSSSS